MVRTKSPTFSLTRGFSTPSATAPTAPEIPPLIPFWVRAPSGVASSVGCANAPSPTLAARRPRKVPGFTTIVDNPPKASYTLASVGARAACFSPWRRASDALLYVSSPPKPVAWPTAPTVCAIASKGRASPARRAGCWTNSKYLSSTIWSPFARVAEPIGKLAKIPLLLKSLVRTWPEAINAALIAFLRNSSGAFLKSSSSTRLSIGLVPRLSIVFA